MRLAAVPGDVYFFFHHIDGECDFELACAVWHDETHASRRLKLTSRALVVEIMMRGKCVVQVPDD